MTDISDPGPARRAADVRPAKPRDNRTSPPSAASAGSGELIACVELFYFAYREFTGEPDEVLAAYKFGRAHHRVLHFVYRHPGLRVAQLLDILRITKQSLARVLRELIDNNFIAQRAGADRRERLLYVTAKGSRLAERLLALQTSRLEAALAAAGPGTEAATRRFLFAMIGADDRARVEVLTRAGLPPPGPASSS